MHARIPKNFSSLADTLSAGIVRVIIGLVRPIIVLVVLPIIIINLLLLG